MTKLDEVKKYVAEIRKKHTGISSSDIAKETELFSVINNANIDEPYVVEFEGVEASAEDESCWESGETGTTEVAEAVLKDPDGASRYQKYREDALEFLGPLDSNQVEKLIALLWRARAEVLLQLDHALGEVRFNRMEADFENCPIEGAKYTSWEELYLNWIIDGEHHIINVWEDE